MPDKEYTFFIPLGIVHVWLEEFPNTLHIFSAQKEKSESSEFSQGVHALRDKIIDAIPREFPGSTLVSDSGEEVVFLMSGRYVFSDTNDTPFWWTTVIHNFHAVLKYHGVVFGRCKADYEPHPINRFFRESFEFFECARNSEMEVGAAKPKRKSKKAKDKK